MTVMNDDEEATDERLIRAKVKLVVDQDITVTTELIDKVYNRFPGLRNPVSEEIVDLNAKREALRTERAIAELDADDACWWAVRDAVAAAMLSSPLSPSGMMTAVMRALLDVLVDRGVSLDQAFTMIEDHQKGLVYWSDRETYITGQVIDVDNGFALIQLDSKVVGAYPMEIVSFERLAKDDGKWRLFNTLDQLISYVEWIEAPGGSELIKLVPREESPVQ